MKKYLSIVIISLMILAAYRFVYYQMSYSINTSYNNEVEVFVKSQDKQILIDQGEGFEAFEIKGVDLGLGVPGKFATEYAIDKATYLRWFKQIQEMGANTIRVYTILQPDFYEAVYEYNSQAAKPLYVIHGLWIDDYVHFSHHNAYDDEFLGQMMRDSETIIDIIHGRKEWMISETANVGGIYRRDISPWVIGYILGVEWEGSTVEYTNHLSGNSSSFQGQYMYTSEEATPFEALLAQLGDHVYSYETNKYHEQRLVAFSNWPTTDPIDWDPQFFKTYSQKSSKVDVEHIHLTDKVKSGVFASYHIYPYYPEYIYDYINMGYTLPEELVIYHDNKEVNTYATYLKMINAHHTIPVVITEFGVPSSRGLAARENNGGRSQGGIDERTQGEQIIQCYKDIMAAGCSGSIIFSWQDEWFKRTWNTMSYSDPHYRPYWSDVQTNEQFFGLLSFDPGKEVSYQVDGDLSEWNQGDRIIQAEENSLSIKYDERFIYFMVQGPDVSAGHKIYIPIDTNPKIGAKSCNDLGITFENDCEFVIEIDGTENSRVMVQKRYEAIKITYNNVAYEEDAYEAIPSKDTPVFTKIYSMLRKSEFMKHRNEEEDLFINGNKALDMYEAGKLLYGNSNPLSEDFNSIADFYFAGDAVEIRVPWAILNFSNPSNMNIYDDYYEFHGVQNLDIDKMYVGLWTEGNSASFVPMKAKALKSWGRNITYHERLKASYYEVQKYWKDSEVAQ